ncbi:MAG: type IV pilin protein [Gammaproteobacteria bacterium]
MTQPHNTSGFSITELLVVISIISILLVAATPFFAVQARKAYRAEALQTLTNSAQALERHYTENNTFVGYDTSSLTGENYNFTFEASATGYYITAVAQDGQANDEQNGTSCAILTLNQAGVQTEADCWD